MSKVKLPPAVLKFFQECGRKGGSTPTTKKKGIAAWPPEERSRIRREGALKMWARRRKEKAEQDQNNPVLADK